MSKSLRITATEEGWDLGWSYLALTGKRPIEKRWTERERETRDEAISWATQTNVGIRTGAVSGGLVVIDIDQGADLSSLDLPDTVTVITGSGGLHLYYRTDVTIKNSASKLAPKVDVRGEGGQVVAVGSVHPATKKMYRYAHDLSPAEVNVQPLPSWVIEVLTENEASRPRKTAGEAKSKRKRGRDTSKTNGYSSAALSYEAERVANAGEGERNDTLNRAAFAMGTLIGAGTLERPEVESVLEDAAVQCGLTINEARTTITSGIEAGIKNPREIKDEEKRPPDAGVGISPPPPPVGGISDGASPRAVVEAKRQPIMIPGAHMTTFGYKEIGNDTFASEVLARLPKGVIYRRGNIPVELVGDPGHQRLQTVTVDRMRLIMDEYIRLLESKKKNETIIQVYKNATRNWAGLVLASAGDSELVREMRLLTHYPVYERNWELAKPGWHNGVYYDQPPELDGMKPREGGWQVIEDLIVDFPFADEADKQNFISLLLTPMIRPAVLGNVPMFLIRSSLPRTGKTKLAEQVTGGIYLGEETPAMQWSTNEDERDKRILSILKQGDTVLHVDNVSNYVDSPALASLVTSKYYQGRILGQSQMVRLENSLTVIATANNPRATGEIVRRAVPITLQPGDDAPELRSDFKHPHLFRHVIYRRPRVWSVMTGLIEKWKEAGRPSTGMKMGGFEGWAEAMSGIMFVAGAEKWMSNWRDWVREADPEGEDLKELVSIWWANCGNALVHAKEILKFAEDNDLFGNVLIRGRTDRGKLTVFATNVLIKYMNAPVDDLIIKRGTGRTYCLHRLRGEMFDGAV